MKEENIITYLRLREIGSVLPHFRNRIIILSRPNSNLDFYE